MELPMLGGFGQSFFGNNSRVESYCQTIHDQLSNLVYNGSLSVCSLFRNPTTQEKNNLIEHYHLQVQANPKKMAQKTMLFLASMGKTGLTHDIFFKFSVGPFEVVEAEGGRLVKEADFEAEKKILL